MSNIFYDLRQNFWFSKQLVKSAKHRAESILFVGPKIWDILHGFYIVIDSSEVSLSLSAWHSHSEETGSLIFQFQQFLTKFAKFSGGWCKIINHFRFFSQNDWPYYDKCPGKNNWKKLLQQKFQLPQFYFQSLGRFIQFLPPINCSWNNPTIFTNLQVQNESALINYLILCNIIV